LSHSALVVIGAGARPDFRFNPQFKVDQRLIEGGLPAVVSQWDRMG